MPGHTPRAGVRKIDRSLHGSECRGIRAAQVTFRAEEHLGFVCVRIKERPVVLLVSNLPTLDRGQTSGGHRDFGSPHMLRLEKDT